MAKAVLVMDMPENCEECPLEYGIEDEKGVVMNANICRGCGKRNFDSRNKPDWCPLRELPEKMDGLMASELVPDCENPVDFAQGWNALREKILGGAE